MFIHECGVGFSEIPELFLAARAFSLTLFGFIVKRGQTVGLLPSGSRASVTHPVSQRTVQKS